MNRLSALIDTMDENELKLIQKDLYEGNISYHIKRKLTQYNNKTDDQNVCPVCGAELDDENTKYRLEFGKNGVRRKAGFDEIDCLSFFVSQLEDMTEILKPN